jgi:hypothetical protein
VFSANAQEAEMIEKDTLVYPVDTLMPTPLYTAPPPVIAAPPPFKPNPRKAVIYSAVFPGLGQIYNRKYWKLPLVYGGFMGFIYAITWNNRNYQDYSDAYFDIISDPVDNPDAWHDSWQSFVPAGRDPADYIGDGNFKSRLKNGKDFYRRYRDLSIILTVGWYLICMADTYVDAQLFDFDISDNLSMQIEPVIAPQRSYAMSYGLCCSIKC